MGRRTKELVEKSEKLAEEIERREALEEMCIRDSSRTHQPGLTILPLPVLPDPGSTYPIRH